MSAVRFALDKTLQIDKVVFTVAATCLLPMVVHALPVPQAVNLGQALLPVFYAPLIAVLIFRPHVALIASALAPALNQVIFGVPEFFMARLLTAELLIFSLILLGLTRLGKIQVGQVVLACVVARAGVLFLSGTGGDVCLGEMVRSLPGLGVMGILTVLVQRLYKEDQ